MFLHDKETPVIEERIMMAVVRVSELFKRKSTAIFARHGLSFSQYNVLRLLEASRDSQCAITEISRRLLISTPNLSGIAKRLEKGGFIRRDRDAADERKTILVLESPGRLVLTEIGNLQEMNFKTFLDHCPENRKQDLLDLLKGMLKLEG
ncbi:MAG: MarR family transcriptional regulator [Pseudomonadota bacterium]